MDKADLRAGVVMPARAVALPGVDVEFHTKRSSEIAKLLLDRFGDVIEERFKSYTDGEQITAQELSDRYSGPLQAARSILVGSIAVYARELDCTIEQIFEITMYDLAAQMSTLMPAKETGETTQ